MRENKKAPWLCRHGFHNMVQDKTKYFRYVCVRYGCSAEINIELPKRRTFEDIMATPIGLYEKGKSMNIISFDDWETLDLDTPEGSYGYVARFLRNNGAPSDVFSALGKLHPSNWNTDKDGMHSDSEAIDSCRMREFISTIQRGLDQLFADAANHGFERGYKRVAEKGGMPMK